MEHPASRRDLLLTSLLAALPLGLSGAAASPLDPAQTIIKLPADLQWKSNPANPARSVDMCPLVGDPEASGLYYTLVRWWPGYMSAPHSYTSDRLCVIVSGIWWCNSGADFDPAACVPVPAGSFVRRVAGTPHYDGVIRSHNEPAVIAICGIGPVNYKIIDPSLPFVRPV
ncbi:cupin domain-containing protein [Methylocapsa sp. S129]|uniref:cupin domain-containing protein n=1 Tax=Methylocapsa sp. S129 TaxID=1641869 RepID=UPI001FEFD024|nr:cupin domain-containing protein [Methylocapsa sp. S129]